MNKGHDINELKKMVKKYKQEVWKKIGFKRNLNK